MLNILTSIFYLLLIKLNQRKQSIINDIPVIRIHPFRNKRLPCPVLDLLDPHQFHQDNIGIGADPHVPPGLVVIMVLVFHEVAGALEMAVVKLQDLFTGKLRLLFRSQFQLDQRHHRIVHDPDKLGPDPFFNPAEPFLFNRPDPVSLDIDLVGQGWRPKNAPGAAVILHFIEEDSLAFGHGLFELACCFCHHFLYLRNGSNKSVAMEKNSDKSTLFSQKRVFEYNGKVMDFTRPRVMGIMNVTPDSFYSAPPSDSQLAYILDIGAVSTRPGAAEVSVEEEKKRLLPVLKKIRKEYPGLIISIDTYRASIARMAAGEGADMINDISGGTFDPDMIPLVSELGIPYVIMHIRGTPQNMQVNPQYQNVTEEVFAFLLQQAKKLEATGHKKIILDPGFGFGKSVEHNYTLLSHLDRLTANGYTVLAGMSRKSMINKILGIKPQDALNGTTVLNTIALLKGVSILRVHDVKEALEAVKLTEKVKDSNSL